VWAKFIGQFPVQVLDIGLSLMRIGADKVTESLWIIIRSRVEQRAGELGRSVRSIMREAGLDVGLIYRNRIASPKIDTLQKIAAAAGLTLPQIMGFDVLGRVPREVVAQALRCANRALRSTDPREEDLISALQIALNMLLTHRQMGYPIDGPETQALVESAIAEARASSAAQTSASTTSPEIPEDTANRSPDRDGVRRSRRR
jgi:hypothetical protein